MQFKLTSSLNPNKRSFVCYGPIFLYYKFNTSKTQVQIQGTFERYIRDKTYQICVDKFIERVLQLRHLDV